MKPWSIGSIAGSPPAATAVLTNWSTSARLLHESAKSPSDCACVLQISFLVNVLKKGSVSSITNASSLTIMQAAFSSVNCGLNPNPSSRKNSIDRFRSRTARLTNSLRERLSAMCRLQQWSPLMDSAARQNSSVAPDESVAEGQESCEGNPNRGKSVCASRNEVQPEISSPANSRTTTAHGRSTPGDSDGL